MHMEMSNNHHAPKTLFAFRKKDEKAVVAAKIEIANRCEQNGVVYATLNCSKDKADLSAVKHLLVGAVAGV